MNILEAFQLVFKESVVLANKDKFLIASFHY
jgi:hypothetical protein